MVVVDRQCASVGEPDERRSPASLVAGDTNADLARAYFEYLGVESPL